MELHKLQTISNKKKRRGGQGHGSGRVKTAGRGTKGQNARSSRSLTFEGGALPLIKRLPFRRGKAKNKVFKLKPIVINVKALNLLPKNSVVDNETLIKYKIVDAGQAKMYGIKILGDGEINIPLIVKIKITKNAAIKIEKAGGKIEALK